MSKKYVLSVGHAAGAFIFSKKKIDCVLDMWNRAGMTQEWSRIYLEVNLTMSETQTQQVLSQTMKFSGSTTPHLDHKAYISNHLLTYSYTPKLYPALLSQRFCFSFQFWSYVFFVILCFHILLFHIVSQPFISHFHFIFLYCISILV